MKKAIFWVFTLMIISCSVIGFGIDDKNNKKELKNILKEKVIREKQVICLKEEEEQNVEKIYYFDDNNIIQSEFDTNIYSSSSDTSKEYKELVEEHFKNLFCDESVSKCDFKWNGKKITLSVKSKIIEDFNGVDKDTLKTKMKKLDSDYKCK